MKKISKLKPVILTIKSLIIDSDNERQEFCLTTEGIFGESENITYLVYDETDVSGMAGSKTTIKMEGNKLTLNRNGEINSRMEFIEGESFLSVYGTPYGDFEMLTKTNKAAHNINPEGGTILLEYDLEIDHNPTQKTTMEIMYRFMKEC